VPNVELVVAAVEKVPAAQAVHVLSAVAVAAAA
jgi:hypothetical protein